MPAFIFQKLLEQGGPSGPNVDAAVDLSLIHISEPTRPY